MNEAECAEAVKDWTDEVLPELAASYDYVSAQKGQLPDAMVDVLFKRVVTFDERFPKHIVQQILYLRVFEVEVAMMGETQPDSSADADETAQLRDFGDRLEASIMADLTLGNRVPFTSPEITFDYSLPFVQYPDGTRGRQLSLQMAIAEPLTQEDSI